MKVSTIAIIAALLAGGYFMFFATPSGFSEEDISNIKSSIKSEFEKRSGVSVQEVTILKEGPNKASGFAKIKSEILGEIIKPCTATMAENGKNYIWRCD
jgi:hypothetical protein